MTTTTQPAQTLIGTARTPFVSGASGSTTAVSGSAAAAPTPVGSPSALLSWLDSDEARSFAGRWVLLEEDMTVIDADGSAATLLERHAQRVSPTIVFVEPRDRPLVV